MCLYRSRVCCDGCVARRVRVLESCVVQRYATYHFAFMYSSWLCCNFKFPSRGWIVYRLRRVSRRNRSRIGVLCYGEVRELRCVEEVLASVIDIHPWLRVAGVVGVIQVGRLVSFGVVWCRLLCDRCHSIV